MDLVWNLPEKEIKDLFLRPHRVKGKPKRDKNERERWNAELLKKVELFVESGASVARLDYDDLSLTGAQMRAFMVTRETPYNIEYKTRFGKLYLIYSGRRPQSKLDLTDDMDVDVTDLLSGLED